MKNKQNISMSLLICILVILVSGCHKENFTAQIKNLNTGDYLVSYSKEMDKVSRFVVYKKDGTIIEDNYQQNGQALGCSSKVNGKYIFTSLRKNQHFIVSPDGSIQEISFGLKKYKPNDPFGTIFSSDGSTTLLSAMNIGDFGKGYECEFIQKNVNTGIEKAIHMNQGLIDSAVEFGNKIYIHISNTKWDVGSNKFATLMEFDKKTGKITNAINITNHSVADCTNLPMKCFNSSILLYGDSLNYPAAQMPPCLTVFDTKSKKIIKTIVLETGLAQWHFKFIMSTCT